MTFALAVATAAYAAQSHSELMPEAAPPEADTGVSVRVKDISHVQGVRDNYVIGIGVVVGLAGTGDGGTLAQQLMKNVLERIYVAPDKLSGDNIAAVKVTATLPAFARGGTKVDVTVSSLDDAESLRGGTLLMTPLYGPDMKTVYVVAQGHVDIGGFSVTGAAASVVKNVPTVGRIPGGGIIEREVDTTLTNEGALQLTLNQEDFVSAQRLADTVNEQFTGTATPIDAKTVNVSIPREYAGDDKIVGFIAKLEHLKMVPDSRAQVVINPRTGTIVAHKHVRIGKVMVSHGNITVVIREDENVSQPGALSGGNTEVTQATSIEVQEHKAYMHVIEPGVSVKELAEALNKLGVTPGDLSAIFQMIKEAGALHAPLIVK